VTRGSDEPVEDNDKFVIDRCKFYEQTGNPVFALLEASDTAPAWCKPAINRMVQGYLNATGDGDATLKAMGLPRKWRRALYHVLIDWFMAEWHRRPRSNEDPSALDLLIHLPPGLDRESAERQLRRHVARAKGH